MMNPILPCTSYFFYSNVRLKLKKKKDFGRKDEKNSSWRVFVSPKNEMKKLKRLSISNPENFKSFVLWASQKSIAQRLIDKFIWQANMHSAWVQNNLSCLFVFSFFGINVRSTALDTQNTSTFSLCDNTVSVFILLDRAFGTSVQNQVKVVSINFVAETLPFFGWIENPKQDFQRL